MKSLSDREALRIYREFVRQMHEDIVAIAAQCGMSREEVNALDEKLRAEAA